MRSWTTIAALFALSCASAAQDDGAEDSTSELGLALSAHPNEHGTFANVSTAGSIDRNHAFFKAFGNNGRSCGTCHLPEDGFTIRTATVKQLFDSTGGQAPLFRPLDATTHPSADVSTVDARRRAYSLLTNRGVFRFTKGLPANAEFTVDAVQDPYNFATKTSLTIYRRPPPTTNLRFAPAFMWDGRTTDLLIQANGATKFHGEARDLTAAEQRSIVDFEMSLYTAQTTVGTTALAPAGGPDALSRLAFTLNQNAPSAPPAAPRTTNVFTLFDGWTSAAGTTEQAVKRGQTIFNTRAFGSRTCSSCHSALDAGSNDHSDTDGTALQAIGTSGESPLGPAVGAQFLPSDLPVYTLKNRATGKTVRTNDPGRALVTGKWTDIGRFRTPALRGVASRAPYFHNGMAKTLAEVVDFYDATLASPSGAPLSELEKTDLVTFLSAL